MSLKRIALLAVALVPIFDAKAELEYAASVGGSYIHIENSDGDGEKNQLDTFSLDPRLSLILNTRRLKAFASASNRFVDRHLSSNVIGSASSDSSNSFPSYDLSASLVVLEDVLTLSGQRSQFYSNSGVTSSLITDEVFRSNSLAKSTRSSTNFNFGIPNPRLFNLSVRGGLDLIETERADSEFGETQEVDSETLNYQALFTQGNEVRNVSWNVLANYGDTKARSQNDVVTERINGSFYVGLFDNVRFVSTGSLEKNELSTGNDQSSSRILEYDSFGAGLSWYKSDSRFFDLTYNISSQQNGERDKYVGVKFNWQFSGRTQASGEYGRRFFGRTGSFSLKHKVRKLRTNVTYSENLTTYSRLTAGDSITSVFVCPDGGDFVDCFVPDTEDYELQVGEQFVPLSFASFEISEEPILRKSLSTIIGYTFRKLKGEFRLSNSKTDFLNTDREQDALYSTLSFALDLNRRASLSLINKYSDITRRNSEAEDAQTEKTFQTALGYNYQLSDKLTIKTEVSYANQDSPVANRDFNTRRLTFSFNYKFK